MKLYQHSIGHGPDLVLLHGWGLHSGIWSNSDDGLAEQLARYYRVTMIDLPGHGLSNTLNDGFSLDMAVSAIAKQLPATTLLAGWSLGGLMALQLARQLPHQISRLVLLTSSACFTRRDNWPTGMPESTLRGFGTALMNDPLLTVQRFLALQVRGSDNERQQLRTLKQTLAERPAARPTALNSGLEILRNTDLRSALPHISQPTLLLYGQHDRIVAATTGPVMAAQMPQARSLTIGGAGHAPFLSHPQQTGQAILEFIHA